MRIRSIAGLLLISTLLGCEKDKASEPAPISKPEVKTLEFDFSYAPFSADTKEVEMLVSQKDGKVLLDTLISARTKHTLTVKSEDTKFNVTTSLFNPLNNSYVIKTYVQVNPDNWHITDNIYNSEPVETEPSTIYYYNVTPENGYLFGTTQSDTSGSTWYSNNITLEYKRRSNTDLAYLVLVEDGRYIFTEVTASNVFVDFLEASTTEKLNFKKPSGVERFSSTLYGYSKAGDYSQPILLYKSNIFSVSHDLQYPTTVIKDFDLTIFYRDAEGAFHSYNHVGANIPAEMDFKPKADFAVTKSEFNDFQIEFAENKPSTYFMTWLSGSAALKIDWKIHLSPEETTFKPKEFIENLNLKFLEGEDFPVLSLYSVTSRTAKDYTHQSMHDYLNNPEAFRNKEQKQYRQIMKRL